MRTCVYCGGTAYPQWRVPDRMFEIGGTFSVGRCARCGTLLLLEDVADLSRHYPHGDYYAYEDTDATSTARRTSFEGARRRLLPVTWSVDHWLAGLAGGDGASVLDVGCGVGAALNLYRAARFETWGVEPDAPAAERARQRGHGVTTGSFDDVDFCDATFSVVRFRHSLEHVADPVNAIDKAVQMLRPGGRCLVEIPNPEGWLASKSGAAWWQLDPPRHVALPPSTVLEGLMARHGCSTELRQTYTFGQGVAATIVFGTQERGRTWAAGWRLRSPWRPTGYRALTYPCYALAVVLDLFGKGDSLRLVFRKATDQ
jgi:SAM-dependent methyltransferase